MKGTLKWWIIIVAVVLLPCCATAIMGKNYRDIVYF